MVANSVSETGTRGLFWAACRAGQVMRHPQVLGLGLENLPGKGLQRGSRGLGGA